MIVQILIIIVVPLVIGIAILMLTSDTMKKIEARLLVLIIVILFVSIGLYAFNYLIPAIIGMFIAYILMAIYDTIS
jgi:hypothetical protein